MKTVSFNISKDVIEYIENRIQGTPDISCIPVLIYSENSAFNGNWVGPTFEIGFYSKSDKWTHFLKLNRKRILIADSALQMLFAGAQMELKELKSNNDVVQIIKLRENRGQAGMALR